MIRLRKLFESPVYSEAHFYGNACVYKCDLSWVTGVVLKERQLFSYRSHMVTLITFEAFLNMILVLSGEAPWPSGQSGLVKAQKVAVSCEFEAGLRHAMTGNLFLSTQQ